MKKRILSLLLAGCMLFEICPFGVAAEEAQEVQQSETLLLEEVSEDLEEPEKADDPAELEALEEPEDSEEPEEPEELEEPQEARYQAEENSEWTYGTLSDACANVYAGGRVELLGDMTTENPVKIRRKLTLTSGEGDPYTITYTTEDRENPLLTTYADVTLENLILDGGRGAGLTTKAELVEVQDGSTLTMSAGAVIQNNDNIFGSESAGGLWIVTGTVVMQPDSLIYNCNGATGGGAGVASRKARLVLNGGEIKGCQASTGGGIFVKEKGNLLMYAGSSISGNKAESGGGIYVDGGILTLADGTVRDNKARYGGGMFFEAGQVQVGNLLVTENVAEVYGGGILAAPRTAVGIGAPNAKFSPRVTGNRSGEGYFDNIYLDGGDTPSSSGEMPTQPMALINALGDAACLGISRWVRPDKTNPYRVVVVPANGYTITEEDLSKFYSNDPAYIVLLREGNVILTNADVVFDNRGHGPVIPGQRLGEDRKVIKPTEPSELGYTFDGWYQEETYETLWDFDEDTVAETQEESLTLYAKWTPVLYNITYELDGGENDAENPDSYTIESETITFKGPTKQGYEFLGWSETSIPQGSTGDKTVTARWKRAHAEPVTPSEPTKPATPSEPAKPATPSEPAKPVTPPESAKPVTPPEPAEPATPAPNLPVQDDQVLEKAQRPLSELSQLETEDHFAYVMGYPDGTIRPEDNITRGEVATIFFRLMREDFRETVWATENNFDDVDSKNWYNNAVSTGAQAGLVQGYTDGCFHGERSITRGEFTAIAARFDSAEYQGPDLFPDISDYWGAEEINRAARRGWINGYPDGLFHPNELITRAEAIALINRMLRRSPAPDGLLEDMIRWPDNPEGEWYYLDIQEATNGHTYDRKETGGVGIWTELTENRDWTELEQRPLPELSQLETEDHFAYGSAPAHPPSSSTPVTPPDFRYSTSRVLTGV